MSGDPRHVPLPSVALAELTNLKDRFSKAIRHASIMSAQKTFTSIPLHAAHPFKTKADGSKESCLEDLCIYSYTPALVRSRQMKKKRVTPSFVAIGQGKVSAKKGKELLTVDSELELVHKLVPATVNRTTISGDATTRAGALEAL
ncbi:hypothetical protein DFJ58DRAFT_726843 [Suillus subalutaceus]|uniref:uncharacterized protein n=1 Tax=Suillus subalutaceus TaxID=48586 RepID=UPI001B876B61|nr:uncharacterized protein DFJ58DRAFT_726843 [Suillus subalutaceus]KAG1857717.1 hypothetical protein DFJ58DRAFT_726843 [Suillus subalutaceus]